ncbi:hypothetical protein FKM82_026829 [Ascaphus truei]
MVTSTVSFPVVVPEERLEIKSETEEPNTEERLTPIKSEIISFTVHDFPATVPERLEIKTETEAPDTEDHFTTIKSEIVSFTVDENFLNEEQNWSSDVSRHIPGVTNANDFCHVLDMSKGALQHDKSAGTVQHTAQTDSKCGSNTIHETQSGRIRGPSLSICGECGKSFTRHWDLLRHMHVHTGEKPFACSDCGRKFGDVSSLRKHNRIHTGERPFTCTECGRSFIQKGNLLSHQWIHTGEKPFKCRVCGKSFTREHDLFAHYHIHTGEKSFVCSECGKKFTLKRSLVAHQRIHARKKPLACSESGK